jgi:hypothetical protein
MKTWFIEVIAGMVLLVAACPATTPDVYRSWFTPTVVPNNFTGDVRFEAEITGLPGTVSFNYNGVDRPMRDDGTGGDRVAGDAVWTCLFTASEVLSKNVANRVHRPFLGTCRFSPAATLNVVAEVWSPSMGLVTPTRSGVDFQETDYVINYVATKAQLTSFNAAFWANRFYQTHGDKYDFLSFVHIAGVRGNRYHAGVRNSVQGIGTALFNSTATYGSAGRLQGFSVFPIPSFYDGGGPGFAHETGHQWINFLSGTPFASGVPHWPKGNVAINVMGFSLPGGVGGQFSYTFTSNGSGGYVVGNPIPTNITTFNAMELYLMGLAAPAEVPAYFVLNNQSQNISSGQTLTAAEITPVTVNDVITAKGPRVPNSADSQKLFRCATIILSEQLLDSYALSFYDFFTRRAEARQPQPYAEGLGTGTSNPFYLATSGRAVCITKIADERPALSITRQANGSLRLNFLARMGVSYQLQRSFDLKAWANEGALMRTPVVNPPVDPPREIIVEPTAGVQQTFYRLQVLY